MKKEITIGDDGAGLGRHFEFFCCKFQNGSERCSLWNAEPKIAKNGKLEILERLRW